MCEKVDELLLFRVHQQEKEEKGEEGGPYKLFINNWRLREREEDLRVVNRLKRNTGTLIDATCQ